MNSTFNHTSYGRASSPVGQGVANLLLLRRRDVWIDDTVDLDVQLRADLAHQDGRLLEIEDCLDLGDRDQHRPLNVIRWRSFEEFDDGDTDHPDRSRNEDRAGDQHHHRVDVAHRAVERRADECGHHAETDDHAEPSERTDLPCRRLRRRDVRVGCDDLGAQPTPGGHGPDRAQHAVDDRPTRVDGASTVTNREGRVNGRVTQRGQQREPCTPITNGVTDSRRRDNGGSAPPGRGPMPSATTR